MVVLWFWCSFCSVCEGCCLGLMGVCLVCCLFVFGGSGALRFQESAGHVSLLMLPASLTRTAIEPK